MCHLDRWAAIAKRMIIAEHDGKCYWSRPESFGVLPEAVIGHWHRHENSLFTVSCMLILCVALTAVSFQKPSYPPDPSNYVFPCSVPLP
jgi:hypothetical protein